MTKKVFGIDTQPGIQRDGTVTDRNFYTDGTWVRFQRGRPRKIHGYTGIYNNAFAWGPSRGVYEEPYGAGGTVIFNAYNAGIQYIALIVGITTSSQTHASSTVTAPIDFTMPSVFAPSELNVWQFDSVFDAQGSSTEYTLAHPGQNLEYIQNNTNTPVLYWDGDTTSGSQYTFRPIGAFTATGSVNGTTTLTLDATSLLVGAGQLVTGTGIPADTYVVSITSGTSVELSNAATTTASGLTFTFDNQISVSGGVVVLHPYVFIYGNNGLIKNSGAGNVNDWVSADANETNVASTKIVKGLPLRGGSNAPSGLFWAIDSLIRVSYTPTTVSTGGSTSTFYWRYDIISSQTSILSSSSVIEYDGVFYWCGVDRFLMYNGVVKEVPNNMNQNYFFDNLNWNHTQKVWVSKVPRYGEIWWFFVNVLIDPNATECNDAIIYNIRENCWYDAGGAEGARRSAGYFSEISPVPIWCGSNIAEYPDVNYINVSSFTIGYAGSGYTDGTYALACTGGSGSGLYANVTVVGGAIVSATVNNQGQPGTFYADGDIVFPTGGTGSGANLVVNTVSYNTYMWQHETGVDKNPEGISTAIQSNFETSNLGWVTGGPAQQSLTGDNYWLRLERVEPDFIQSGDMDLYVTGRPYAQQTDSTTGPYTFTSSTNKIDMKEQRRELRLKFESNTVGGDYQLGYTILSADIGDVRGY